MIFISQSTILFFELLYRYLEKNVNWRSYTKNGHVRGTFSFFSHSQNLIRNWKFNFIICFFFILQVLDFTFFFSIFAFVFDFLLFEFNNFCLYSIFCFCIVLFVFDFLFLYSISFRLYLCSKKFFLTWKISI